MKADNRLVLLVISETWANPFPSFFLTWSGTTIYLASLTRLALTVCNAVIKVLVSNRVLILMFISLSFFS